MIASTIATQSQSLPPTGKDTFLMASPHHKFESLEYDTQPPLQGAEENVAENVGWGNHILHVRGLTFCVCEAEPKNMRHKFRSLLPPK